MLSLKELSLKFVKYSFVGFICTMIYFLSVFILVELFKMDPLWGSTISFIIMTIFSFFLNKKITFSSNFSQIKLIRFFIVSSLGFVLNFLIIFLTVNVLSLHYLIGELITILVIPFINFILNNYWTFKEESLEQTV